MIILVCNDDVNRGRHDETLNRGARETYKCGETRGDSAGTFSEIDTASGERNETSAIAEENMRVWKFTHCWTI